MKKLLFLSLYSFIFSCVIGQNSTQTINLPAGWSLFSTYMEPSQANISAVMLPVIADVIMVKNGGGNVFCPQYGLNSIGDIEAGGGYQVKMASAQNLTITGTQLIPENTPIFLPQGWSMIGYLRQQPTNISGAFGSILYDISMLKDDNGNVYWPSQQINQINQIMPGEGYQIKLLSPVSLTYAPNSFACGTDVAVDYDGNIYHTVQIGPQCWLKENMKATHYPDGTALVDGTNAGNIGFYSTSKYWFVYQNNIAYKDLYGLLYTWAAAMNGEPSFNSNYEFEGGVQGICPTGYNVPTDNQWTILISTLGGASDAGGKMKDKGYNFWLQPNTGATNSSEFTALPGGGRNYSGYFYDLNQKGYWWSSTEDMSAPELAWIRYIDDNSSSEYSNNSLKTNGYSVRCVRDTNQASLPTVTTSGISTFTQTTANGGGEVTSDGGAAVFARGICWSTSGYPNTSDSHTTDGTGTGIFTSNITGLSASTKYYVRAYATNNIGTAYGDTTSFTTSAVSFVCGTSTISDYDNNIYNTVLIGTQCWMRENLATTHYANGAALSNGIGAGNIAGDYTTKYWFVYDDNISNKSVYGLMYTWAAIMNTTAGSSSNPSGVQGICPANWHVPSDAEWTQLTDFLGGSSIAGGKLKETGTSHWVAPNVGADGIIVWSSGFNALPGGARSYDGTFYYLGLYGTWWSATEYSNTEAWTRFMENSGEYVASSPYFKSDAYSIRCVKD